MFGNRIHKARKALGLSLRELAVKVSLSHAAIKKYEDNIVTPSSDILIKLSKALQVKVEYFFRPDHFTLENIQYRKHADMPERHLQEITAKILDQIERWIELESLFPSPLIKKFASSEVKKIKKIEDVEALANQIRSEWSLGFNPIPNVMDLFEEHGIKVFQVDNSQYPKFDGLYAKVNDIPVIVVGSKLPGDRERFTLAHELAHFLLDDQISKELDIEKCCHRFAGSFLLPSESLIDLMGKHRNSLEPRELSIIKQEFGISMTAILHRLEETEIISEKVYKLIRSEFNKLGWNKLEPGIQYPQEISYTFEKMVFHALAEDYISESKAAELMNMTLESFRPLRAMRSENVTDQRC